MIAVSMHNPSLVTNVARIIRCGIPKGMRIRFISV